MRYFTVSKEARAWYEYEPDVWAPTQPSSITVTVSDAVATGLIDEHGAAIMKSRDPMGFLK